MHAARRGKSRTQALQSIPKEIWNWHTARGHVIRDARIAVETYRSVIMIFISSVNGKNMFLWEKKNTFFDSYELIKSIKTRRGI